MRAWVGQVITIALCRAAARHPQAAMTNPPAGVILLQNGATPARLSQTDTL